ncbi:hypothetical protein GCM10011354_06860 [Egicoccus halophilus]|uniref:Uncharacterized protein n=1 Tax=Egicoccus halophilus TaxID=1670830 RepID=A0A8J3A821_9ACTN|nr:hypothetical protein GCM10011354_06860 [Egicoccus halophilus]
MKSARTSTDCWAIGACGRAAPGGGGGVNDWLMKVPCLLVVGASAPEKGEVRFRKATVPGPVRTGNAPRGRRQRRTTTTSRRKRDVPAGVARIAAGNVGPVPVVGSHVGSNPWRGGAPDC